MQISRCQVATAGMCAALLGASSPAIARQDIDIEVPVLILDTGSTG